MSSQESSFGMGKPTGSGMGAGMGAGASGAERDALLMSAASAGLTPRAFPSDVTERRIQQLKRRVVREGTVAVAMLEASLAALSTLDVQAARRVRRTDDQIDFEEVEIEQECYELLALHHPFGRDFRMVAFCLRANADLERVADHASSLAKLVVRMRDLLGTSPVPIWPTALLELSGRMPTMCHQLLKAVLDEDEGVARRLVASDEVIDQLERRLYEEAQELMRAMGRDDTALALGMLVYRAGRELERVGDMMAAIAEDVVYLTSGEIIRHAKRRAKQSSDRSTSGG
jgi:phosphate transport system protein